VPTVSLAVDVKLEGDINIETCCYECQKINNLQKQIVVWVVIVNDVAEESHWNATV
jgi:hypothetical protein